MRKKWGWDVLGLLAGKSQYFRKIFLNRFSGMVENCGKLEVDCV